MTSTLVAARQKVDLHLHRVGMDAQSKKIVGFRGIEIDGGRKRLFWEVVKMEVEDGEEVVVEGPYGRGGVWTSKGHVFL